MTRKRGKWAMLAEEAEKSSGAFSAEPEKHVRHKERYRRQLTLACNRLGGKILVNYTYCSLIEAHRYSGGKLCETVAVIADEWASMQLIIARLTSAQRDGEKRTLRRLYDCNQEIEKTILDNLEYLESIREELRQDERLMEIEKKFPDSWVAKLLAEQITQDQASQQEHCEDHEDFSDLHDPDSDEAPAMAAHGYENFED